MLLSVVVPVYKKEKIIKKDLENVAAALKEMGVDYEIIAVIDGKIDRSWEEAGKVKSSKVKAVGYEKNRGKGYALRYGMARSKGDLVAFLDAGMEINPKGLSILLEHLKWYNADAIIGSKRHPASKVNYPPERRIISFGYQLMIWVLFGLRVRDTQTGIKLFRREVLENVLPRLLVKEYAIDIEILAVARHLGFKRIFEAPVDVSYKFEDLTHASTLYSIWRMFRDTLAVFYRLKILHYYDDKSKRKWIYDKDLDMRLNVG